MLRRMKCNSCKQTTAHLLLVRPANFGPNVETASSNRFQHDPGGDEFPEVAAAARCEFDALVAALRRAGALPFVVDDSVSPAKPDAVFPNNWVSFHRDGRVILYPMEAPVRRLERRRDVLQQLSDAGLVRLDRVLDLSRLEQKGWFLEGTGSLVMDRGAGLAYASLSSRTHPRAVAEFARRTAMDVCVFRATDQDGCPIYHTNVMLAIGTRFAVICAETIRPDAERRRVLRMLADSGREIIEIDLAQMRAFAANILEVGTATGGSLIAMSQTALQALKSSQESQLRRHAEILAVPVPTIERVGGGSVRCMIAEVFVPAST